MSDIFPNSTYLHNIGYTVDCNCEGNNNLLLSQIAVNTKASADAAQLALGYNAHEFVTDNSLSSETFIALVAYDGDATVNYTLTQLDGTTINHAGITLSQGDVPTYGIITNLNVTSGTVKAYYDN